MARAYFKVVVETGSCSMDGRRWEERATCKHMHKTFAAAFACQQKLQRERDGQCSARWYNATIHDQDGARV